jgi:hypothetical protein
MRPRRAVLERNARRQQERGTSGPIESKERRNRGRGGHARVRVWQPPVVVNEAHESRRVQLSIDHPAAGRPRREDQERYAKTVAHRG